MNNETAELRKEMEKTLEEVKKEHDFHVQKLRQLESAKENCIALINSIKGKIQVLEELLKGKEGGDGKVAK